MDEYIKREDAIRLYQNVCNNVPCKDCPFLIRITDTLTDCRLEKFIHDLPFADVVEVIRCRDCKYREETGTCGMRPWLYLPVKDNGFCSEGERRTDETD